MSQSNALIDKAIMLDSCIEDAHKLPSRILLFAIIVVKNSMHHIIKRIMQLLRVATLPWTLKNPLYKDYVCMEFKNHISITACRYVRAGYEHNQTEAEVLLETVRR